MVRELRGVGTIAFQHLLINGVVIPSQMRALATGAKTGAVAAKSCHTLSDEGVSNRPREATVFTPHTLSYPLR